MTEYALALGLIAAPLLPLAFSHPAGLERVRDWWLRSVLMLGALLAPLWLWPLIAWYAIRWPQQREPWTWLPHMAIWTGIGLSWALLQRVPTEAWEFIGYGWVAIACWYIGRMIQNGLRIGWRSFGTREPATGLMGSPVMLAQFLALSIPFAPWWTYPLYAIGLWLTCSGAAFCALSAGGAIYFWGPL